MHMGGGYLRYRTNFLESLPIPRNLEQSHKDNFKTVSNLVKKILRLGSDQNNISKVNKLEDQIDKIVYELYGLTQEEIRIVEEKNKQQ